MIEETRSIPVPDLAERVAEATRLGSAGYIPSGGVDKVKGKRGK